MSLIDYFFFFLNTKGLPCFKQILKGKSVLYLFLVTAWEQGAY